MSTSYPRKELHLGCDARIAALEAEVETLKVRVGRANASRDLATREFHRVASDLRVLRGRLRALVGDETPGTGEHA